MLNRAFFEERTREIVALLKELVEIESPSHDKNAVDRVGARIAAELRRLGAKVDVTPQTRTGDHVTGRFCEGPGSGILTLCHMDTVHPVGMLGRNPCVERDGKMHGPGALDMKAGIAILLAAARIMQEAGSWPQRPVTMLFTSDEEIGSHTSRELIETLARQAELVLCLESSLPDGGLKVWRKGVGDFEVTAYGRAAHAGADHAQGRNAIEELAYQVIALQKMTDYEKGTTLNVGMIQGGTASNVIPDVASLTVDVRVQTPEGAERVTRQVMALKPVLEGTHLEITGGLNRPPMPHDDLMEATFQKARAIAEKLGISLTAGGTGGGSDANFVAPLGVPVLDGLGGTGSGLHSEREQVEIASLPARAALLAALLSEW